MLKVSVCITVFNESEKTIEKLLDALDKQTLKADEIIIIDAKDYNNCSRAKGRNIAIKKSKNEIIAITDAGCIPHNNWLEEIIKPYTEVARRAHSRSGIVVAGGYRMIAKNSFQKAEAVFLGAKQKDMDKNFMPSARSMAFTKSIWKKAGGFPEKQENTAEDTLFNVNLLKVGAKFVTAKSAIVDWYMPSTLFEFFKKIFNYAKGDIKSGIWWHPVKKWQTHNLKILTIYLRYLIIMFSFSLGPVIPVLLVILYLLFAYKKANWWGIILQFTSDFAVMTGFLRGII